MSSKTIEEKTIRICGADISAFSIELPKDATETERFAARELQSYLKKATGVSLLHIKEEMTEAEQKAHEEAFEQFIERKTHFKQHVNLYTATQKY